MIVFPVYAATDYCLANTRQGLALARPAHQIQTFVGQHRTYPGCPNHEICAVQRMFWMPVARVAAVGKGAREKLAVRSGKDSLWILRLGCLCGPQIAGKILDQPDAC